MKVHLDRVIRVLYFLQSEAVQSKLCAAVTDDAVAARISLAVRQRLLIQLIDLVASSP